jgi:hypothetical protein
MKRRLADEGIGSFLLFATVIGSGIMAERLAGGNVAVALLGNTAATGAMLFVLITMLGPISGAHFNPAVSLVMALRRTLSWRDMIAYTAMQIGCGVLGAWAAHVMFECASPANIIPCPHWHRPMDWRGDCDFWSDPYDHRHFAPPATMDPGQRRALHHCRLLVHLINQLRQPGYHNCAEPNQQLFRDRASGCANVHCSAARRSGGCNVCVSVSLRVRACCQDKLNAHVAKFFAF